MEIHLSPEQQSRLAALAARDGCNTAKLVQDAVTRFINDEARFAEAVKLGLDAAERGDFVPSDKVWAGVERIDANVLLARVRAIQAEVAQLPVLDTRSPEEIIGYNERGHFD